MSSKIAEIDAQIAKLQQQRVEELKVSRAAALADVKAKIKAYTITPTDLKGVLKPLRVRKAKSGDAVVAKKVAKPATKKARSGQKQGPKKA